MRSHTIANLILLHRQFIESTCAPRSQMYSLDFIGNRELEGRSPSKPSWWGAGGGRVPSGCRPPAPHQKLSITHKSVKLWYAIEMTTHIPNHQTWAAQELATACLGDARLNQRLVRIVADKLANPTASIPQASGSWAATKATYIFAPRSNFPPTASVPPISTLRVRVLPRITRCSSCKIPPNSTLDSPAYHWLGPPR